MAARRVYIGTRGPTYLDPVERLRLEGQGDMVPQAAAQTESDRWLALIRSASAPVTPSWFRFLGGDVTDQALAGAVGRINIGSDFFAGTTIANDRYVGAMLPLRNGAIVEQPDGTFNRQLYLAGNTGPWMTPESGPHPGRHYWPICCVMDPGNADRLLVGAWLVNTPTATAPYGRLEDTHLLSCSLGFGGAVAQTMKFGFAGSGPHILKFWSDATHIYSLWEDFYPDYDPDVPGPTYGIGDASGSDLPYHHSRIKLARATNADVDVLNTWRWWNGSTWVVDKAEAVYLSDTEGNPVRGDFDVTQVGDGTLRGVGHALVDTHVDVWAAENITSPWERICRVRTPGMGARINGGLQIGQFARFVEHVAAPAEHSVVQLSLNLLEAPGSAAGRNIRRYAPQHVVVPHYPG